MFLENDKRSSLKYAKNTSFNEIDFQTSVKILFLQVM